MIRKIDVGSAFGTAQRTSYEYMKLLTKIRFTRGIIRHNKTFYRIV